MKSPDVAAFIQNHSTKIAVANSCLEMRWVPMFGNLGVLIQKTKTHVWNTIASM